MNQLERLKFLLEALKTTETVFDIRVFLIPTYNKNHSPIGLKNDFKTTCCAVGLACVLPEFKKLGFYFSNQGYPIYNTKLFETDTDHTTFVSWAAVTEFFGLYEGEAMKLFLDYSYNDVKNTENYKKNGAIAIKQAVIYRLEQSIIAHERDDLY